MVRGSVKSGDGWREMTALRAAVPSYHTTHTRVSQYHRRVIPRPHLKHTPRQFKFLLFSSPPLRSSFRSRFVPSCSLANRSLHAHARTTAPSPLHSGHVFFSYHEVPKTHALSLHGKRNMACPSPFLHIQYRIRTSPAFSPSSLFRPPKYPGFSSSLFRRS